VVNKFIESEEVSQHRGEVAEEKDVGWAAFARKSLLVGDCDIRRAVALESMESNCLHNGHFDIHRSFPRASCIHDPQNLPSTVSTPRIVGHGLDSDPFGISLLRHFRGHTSREPDVGLVVKKKGIAVHIAVTLISESSKD